MQLIQQSLFTFLALIAAETVQKMNKVEMRARASSFIETIRTRSGTITSREDVTDTASMTSSMTSNTNTRERSPLLTPQYLNTDMMTSDQFNYDMDHVSIRSGSTRYDFKGGIHKLRCKQGERGFAKCQRFYKILWSKSVIEGIHLQGGGEGKKSSKTCLQSLWELPK